MRDGLIINPQHLYGRPKCDLEYAMSMFHELSMATSETEQYTKKIQDALSVGDVPALLQETFCTDHDLFNAAFNVIDQEYALFCKNYYNQVTNWLKSNSTSVIGGQ